jgi:protocatechuate 3,4-dioxygenase beta subunit
VTNTRRDEPISAEIAARLDGCTSTCRLLAEQEEGPYRRGDQPYRRNIHEGRPGAPLGLGLRLRTVSGDAVSAADVEIWHCDAEGRYSGYPPPEPTAAVDPSPQRAEYLPDETFLRGRQTSDAGGSVEFRTIYPGWYPGRTVHIHLLVHVADCTYISQLYFPEDVTAEVFSHPSYQARGLPDTTHAGDEILPTGGEPAVLETCSHGDTHLSAICLVVPADRETR